MDLTFTLIFFVTLSFANYGSAGGINAIRTNKTGTRGRFFALVRRRTFGCRALATHLGISLGLPNGGVDSHISLGVMGSDTFRLSIRPFLNVRIFHTRVDISDMGIVSHVGGHCITSGCTGLGKRAPVRFGFCGLRTLFAGHLFLPKRRKVDPGLCGHFGLGRSKPTTRVRMGSIVKLLCAFVTSKRRGVLSAYVSRPSSHCTLR